MMKLALVIAALALTAQANVAGSRQKRAEQSDKCTGDNLTSGPFANPDDCSTYYQCSNGYLYTMPCPTGLVFNPDSGMCDYLDNVPVCQPTEPPPPESEYETKVICEHDTGKITCDKFHSLVIKDAFYGRDDGETCGGPVKTTDCKAKWSEYKISDKCQSERSCTLYASNSVFGDPCVGTFKYVKVTYKCRRGGDIID